MTIVARLAVRSYGSQPEVTLEFQVWATDDGWSPYQKKIQLEELRAAGVDGIRFRNVGQQFPEFQARSIQTAASYKAALALAETYEKCQGRPATFQYIDPNIQFPLMVKAVRPLPSSGVLAGETTTGGMVEATWTLQGLVS